MTRAKFLILSICATVIGDWCITDFYLLNKYLIISVIVTGIPFFMGLLAFYFRLKAKIIDNIVYIDRIIGLVFYVLLLLAFVILQFIVPFDYRILMISLIYSLYYLFSGIGYISKVVYYYDNR